MGKTGSVKAVAKYLRIRVHFGFAAWSVGFRLLAGLY